MLNGGSEGRRRLKERRKKNLKGKRIENLIGFSCLISCAYKQFHTLYE